MEDEIMAKLTVALVRTLKTPGKYGDGDGLWLYVTTAERRSWFLHYHRHGKAHEMSLGSAALVTLAQARQHAHSARQLLAKSIDPIAHRRAEHRRESAQATPIHSFTAAAEAYIAAHEAGWRSPIHRKQWRSTLATYAAPVIGARPVRDIATDHVLAVLQPIWTIKPETASRLRGRIELILSYATARGWRDGPNPAVWRGHLQLMLPAPGKVRPVEHHAALDWREAPAFMAELYTRDSFGARALAFLILTAARSGEVRGARWEEIDADAATWTIPARRMKGGRAHRVPLSAPALAILDEMAKLKDGSGLVFLGMKHGVVLSDMTLTAVLRRMGRGDLTAHGFRSSFRDWAADNGWPGREAEAALAHTIGDNTRAAYERTDLFDPRRKLMAEWADYLSRPPAKVVALHPEPPLVALRARSRAAAATRSLRGPGAP
jgi:integrase